MDHQTQITEVARAYHERMFPGYVSDFLRTDPEFIERFGLPLSEWQIDYLTRQIQKRSDGQVH